MTKKELIKKALESPALTRKSTRKGIFAYPSHWNHKVPLKVRMTQTVTSDMPMLLGPKDCLICVQGNEYYAWVNSYGGLSAILPNGEQLGLKPDEFEITEWHNQ